jgi:adenosine deaminase
MPGDYFERLLQKYSALDVLDRAPAKHADLFRRCGHLRPFFAASAVPSGLAANLFRYRTFEEFLLSFLFTSYFFREIDDLRGLIAAVRHGLERQHIVYAEITVSVGEYVNQGIPLPEILTALDEAAKSPGVRVQWIVDLVRNFGPEATLRLLREIVALKPASVAGITLGGAEHLYPPALFAELYRLARDHGLRLSVHAGEALGPESVWDAIRTLGVERIGHGVRSIEDRKLVEHLAGQQIPLEVCPTSNLRTGVYPSYEAHPVRLLYEAGVPISINTDDPTFFGTTLASEFRHLQDAGFADEDLLELVRNGFRHAFLSPADKRGYLEQVERHWSEHRRDRVSTGGAAS